MNNFNCAGSHNSLWYPTRGPDLIAQALMFDGRIVAAGATYSPDSPGSFALARYNNTDDRFDVHLQGETSGRSLGLNSMTGEGMFADWDSWYTLAGTGRLRVRGCKINMEDRGADYTLSAKVNHCALAGKTTLQLQSQGKTFVIKANNISQTLPP